MTVSEKGFSLIELIVVLAMVAIIAAIAAPSIVEWRQGATYNNVSYKFIGLLRYARSQAIASKRENIVKFKPATGEYQYLYTDENGNPKIDDFALPSHVAIRANDDCQGTAEINFTFASDGTGLTDGTNDAICIMEDPHDGSALVARSRISLTSRVTGRVVMDKP